MLNLWIRHPLLVGLGLFLLLALAVLGMVLWGIRLGRGREPRVAAEPLPGVGVVEGAVFGLFGLLLAFAFSGAAERFHARKALILQEAQALGTAWSRLDLFPPEARLDLQGRFRSYLDTRLEAYASQDVETFQRLLHESEAQGGRMLTIAAQASLDPRSSEQSELMMPPINEMLDIGLARRVAAGNHPPLPIYGLLLAFSFAVALLVGLSMAPGPRRSWIHIVGFSLVVAATLSVTFDLELPRVGFIRVTSADTHLHELRASWN